MFKPHPAPKIIHPCGTDTCKCAITKQFVSKQSHRLLYEVQMDKYKCGPVSVINALHFVGKDSGPALRRGIIAKCKTRPVHSDGFKGTKPEDMSQIVRFLWPTHSHYVGIQDCRRAFRNKNYFGYIVLYSAFRQNKEQYYHYIFTYKSQEDNRIFISQNDGSDEELFWTLSTFTDEHFSIEGNTPIQFPQIWAVA